MAKQEQKQKKGAKKSFYEVKASMISTKIMLYASSQEELENRIVTLDLTKNLRGKSLELKLRVKKEGEELIGHPEKLELTGSYVRRAVRKGTDYVEDSFEAECRDCFARIKPLLLTRMRVPRTILKALRNECKKQTEIYLKTRTAQELFSEIMTNKFQKQLAAKLKKIYPLALCEIRIFEVVKTKDKKEEPAQ
jgi:ribosomal protein S3AE